MSDSREHPFGSAKKLVGTGETTGVRRSHSLLGKPVSQRRELFENSKTRTLPGRKVASKRQLFENKSATIARDKTKRTEKTTTTWKPTQKLNEQTLDESRISGTTGNSSERMVSVGLAKSRREMFDNLSGPRKGVVRGQSVRERREFFECPNTQIMRSQSVKTISEVLKTPKNAIVRDKTMTFRELRDIFEDRHPPTANLKSMKSIDYLHKTSGEEIVSGGSSKSEGRRLDNRRKLTSQWIPINPGENIPQTLRQLEELGISSEETRHNSETAKTQRPLRTTQSTRVSPNSVTASATRNVPNIIITDETHTENLWQNLQDVTTSENQAAINQHPPLEEFDHHMYENVSDDRSDRASNNSFVDDFSSDEEDFSHDEDNDIYERID